MKPRHARKIALAAALAAIGVAAVAGWVSRGYFIEEWLMRRLVPTRVIAWGSSVTAAGLAGFLLAPNAAVMGVSLLAFGAGAGAGITAAYTAGGRVVPASAHATGFGFLTGSSLAGLALSPVLAGALSRSHLLAVFAVDLVLLVGIALVTVRSATPRSPNPESRIPES